ncbi:MAG: hypothetical protein M3O86_00220, partial [Actinomycetota bacterium]|nr:hypothetical protein [Actinomycetota bacterium]
AAGYAYQLSTSGAGCDALIVDHYRFRDGSARTQLRQSCRGERAPSQPLADATVQGATITVTVPLSPLPASVVADGTLRNVYAYTRGNIGDGPTLFPAPLTPVQFDSKESREPFTFGG